MKKRALIIANLGSPDSYSVSDVRSYLNEFLTDERVIDMSWLQRQLVVRGIIVPFRAPKSAEAYKTIWTDKGSPLIVISKDFQEKVRQKVDMPVALAMRYGKPTPEDALTELEKNSGKPDEILVAPMYPHYAMSSYETAVEHLKKHVASKYKDVQLKILKPFYNEPSYISSLAASIQQHLAAHHFDAYLFSYHGLPVRHLKKADPTHNHCYSSGDCCEIKSIAWQTCYKHQVKETTKLVATQLNLEPTKTLLTFQSRLGSDPWLQPYTDTTLTELPKKGIKKLLVICPAFVADCLETLEEIMIRGKESFIESGGEELIYSPCLNTQPQWVDTFSAYCNECDGRYEGMWE